MRPRRVTIKDVAAEAGVSIALVSFVMNNKANGKDTYRVNKHTAERILEVARKLDYQTNSAARTLRCGRTNTIGVIVSDISNKFFADIARCIEDRAYKYNYTVLFGSTDENVGKLHNLIDVFLNKGVDGLIIVPCDDSDFYIQRVAESQLPLVLLDREVADTDLSCVVLNNLKAGQLVAESLLARGCKRIEMISYSMGLSNIRDREDGFRLTMMKAGVEVDDNSIQRLRHDRLQDDMDLVLKMARERGADGLLFATNALALAGLKTIAKMGWRIPGDFAVATFDGNDAFDIHNTEISYIQQPIAQFGTDAVDLLLKSIDGKAKNEPVSSTRIILAPRLVENKPEYSKMHEDIL